MLKRGFQFAPGYRLQEFLGRGQFGQVWRATAPGGTAAAVKFIDLSDGQGQKEYNGIKRVKQIRHANLMPIIAIWLLDGEGKVIEEAPDEAMETIEFAADQTEPIGSPPGIRPAKKEIEPSWLVVAMLLGGKSLQQRMRECKDDGLPGIPPKELIGYMDESAKGLDFLNAPQHDLGEGPIAIQHSDVKPANIVLIGSSAVVCDFGLARILTRNQVTATSAAGTPAYMAPEAISGKPARSSDQYSLAVTYYHLRTGMLPLNDGSLWEVLDAHRQGHLKFSSVSEGEQEVLRKATALKWENRFESNLDMVDALREALRSEGHTRPTFVPQASQQKTVPNFGGTVAEVDDAGDPTATLDHIQPSSSISEQPTREVVQAAEKTADKIHDKTVPSLDGDIAPPPRPQWLQQIQRNPKIAVGAGGAVLVLVVLLLASIGNRDPDQNTETETGPIAQSQSIDQNSGTNDQNHSESSDSNHSTQQENELSAEQWYAKAIQDWLGKEEASAIESFLEAKTLDPSIELPRSYELQGVSEEIIAADFSTDGTMIVAAADVGKVWDTKSQQPVASLAAHTDWLEAFALRPQDNRLATIAADGQLLLWDLSQYAGAGSLDQLQPLREQNSPAASSQFSGVVWHPTKSLIATTTRDPSVRIWQVEQATTDSPRGVLRRVSRLAGTDTLLDPRFDSQARWLVARSGFGSPSPSVYAYRWSELEAAQDEDAAPTPIKISPEGSDVTRFDFASDRDGIPVVVVGNSVGGVLLFSLQDPPQLLDEASEHKTGVESLVVRRSEQLDHVVSGAIDGSVHWWQLGNTQQQQTEQFGRDSIASVDVSQDGRWVVAGSLDGSVWLWDARPQATTAGQRSTGKVLMLSAGAPVNVVRIDPTEQWLLVAGGDGVIKMWDLNHAKLALLAGKVLEIDREDREGSKPAAGQVTANSL